MERIPALICAVIAALLLCGAALIVQHKLSTAVTWEEVDGRVAELEGGDTPIVVYYTRAGEPREYVGLASQPPDYGPGAFVRVQYAPDPGDVRIDSFQEQWLAAVVCAGIGGVIGLIGWLMYASGAGARRAFRVLFVVIGCGASLLAGQFLWAGARSGQGWTAAQAVVTDIQERTLSRGGHEHVLFAAVLSVEPAGGTPVAVTDAWSFAPRAPVGARLAVQHPSGDPSRARVSRDTYRWLPIAWSLGLAATAFLLAALVRRTAQPAAPPDDAELVLPPVRTGKRSSKAKSRK